MRRILNMTPPGSFYCIYETTWTVKCNSRFDLVSSVQKYCDQLRLLTTQTNLHRMSADLGDRMNSGLRQRMSSGLGSRVSSGLYRRIKLFHGQVFGSGIEEQVSWNLWQMVSSGFVHELKYGHGYYTHLQLTHSAATFSSCISLQHSASYAQHNHYMNVFGGRELKNHAKLFAIKNYLGLLHVNNTQFP